MSTRGRGRSRQADTTEPAGAHAPTPAGTEPTAELLEEQSTVIASNGAGTRAGARLGRSLAGAVAGTLLIAGLAFGAALGPGGTLGPKLDGDAQAGGQGAGAGAQAGDTAAGGADGEYHEGSTYHDGDASHEGSDGTPAETSQPDGTGVSDGTGESGGDEPKASEAPGDEPGGDPAPEPTRKPEPRPEPDPTRAPVTSMNLELWIGDGRPVMEWSACEGIDFDAYKVVRSTDATVSWPLAEHDTLIAVVERGGNRKAWDNDAPRGQKDWYRVFCVRHSGDGYRVVGSSDARGILVPEPPAPPDPVSLELHASINDEGHVTLSWSACNVDGFGAYKVLRSTSTEEPSYLPYHDGTDVIGVVETKSATQWYDAGGDPGQTVSYRVQCIGWVNGTKVLLGQTAVVAVTMP